MKAEAWAARSCFLTLLAVGAIFLWASPPASAAVPFSKGDVFVSIGDGKINHYGPTGTFKETLNTGTGVTNPPGNMTGMCFDPSGRLYATDFDAAEMSRFDNTGALITHPFGPPQDFPPNSCAVDATGSYIYTGLNEGDNRILKLDNNGTLVRTFFVAVDVFGVSYIDLAQDGCTMYYTSEGTFVLRYNVCTGQQLADFASGLPSPCFAIRLRSNGEAIVACDLDIVRLNSSGTIVQHYTPGNENDYYALALDPDGTSFWAAGYGSGRVWKVNIATGAISTTFTAPLTVVDSGAAGVGVFGDGPVEPGFARPKGASPLRASLVPAYQACTSGNRMHGNPPPLNKPSCAPPVQTSNFLTLGTPEATPPNQANSNGFALFTALVGNGATVADEADLRIASTITDVRNKSNLSDYAGELQLSVSLRSTDRLNSQEPATQPFDDSGTGQDTPFLVRMPCVTTTATNVGSTCSVNTTADAVIPNAIKESQRTVFGMGPVQVFDGGADGLVSTSGNTLFEDQGIFVP